MLNIVKDKAEIHVEMNRVNKKYVRLHKSCISNRSSEDMP